MEPKGRGRPTIFTRERVAKLLEWLSNGVPPVTACSISGISHRAYVLRRTEGRKGKSPEAKEFLRATNKAIAEHEAKLVLVLEQAAMSKDPKVGPENAKFLLERRYWKRWSSHHKNEVTGKNGGPVVSAALSVDISKLSDEELARLSSGDASFLAGKG